MPRPFPIAIQIDGRTYSGDWQLLMGGRVCVRSLGFGSEIADVGRAKPEAVAAKTLERLIRTDQKKRAALAKQREREIAKVNRYWDRQRLDDGP